MTPALWDGDTGTVTVTASVNGAAVNLSGTTQRHLIVRNRSTRVVTELTISGTGTDLPNGKVVANAVSLPSGPYLAILRVTDSGGNIVTYPSADVGAATFEVKADIDAA